MAGSRLTDKHQMFIKNYAKTLNLSASVMDAYPQMSYGAARAYGVYLKSKHPIVSACIKDIHQSIADSIDPQYLIEKYKRAYDDHYMQKITLTTQTSNGTIIVEEKIMTHIAMEALDGLIKIREKIL